MIVQLLMRKLRITVRVRIPPPADHLRKKMHHVWSVCRLFIQDGVRMRVFNSNVVTPWLGSIVGILLLTFHRG